MGGLLFALGGLAIGGLSTYLSGEKQKAALRQQKENAWQGYLINKESADTQFAINKGEALTGLGIQQGRLREDLNTGVENYNTGLLGQAYGIQDARINLAGQMGAADAAQGMSGTRGNEASGLMKAYALNSFERNAGLQEKQNDQALGAMMTGANRSNQDIEREKDSWGEGGYRTQLYNAEDERNRKLAQMGQDQYDQAITAANPGIFDYLAGGFQGMSTGLSLYSGFHEADMFTDGNGKNYVGKTSGNDGNKFTSIGGGNEGYRNFENYRNKVLFFNQGY